MNSQFEINNYKVEEGFETPIPLGDLFFVFQLESATTTPISMMTSIPLTTDSLLKSSIQFHTAISSLPKILTARVKWTAKPPGMISMLWILFCLKWLLIILWMLIRPFPRKTQWNAARLPLSKRNKQCLKKVLLRKERRSWPRTPRRSWTMMESRLDWSAYFHLSFVSFSFI